MQRVLSWEEAAEMDPESIKPGTQISIDGVQYAVVMRTDRGGNRSEWVLEEVA